MADKYVDVSATFNGDGTSSAQAASDGAAGAWNSLISVLLNTPGHGSVDAGDVVHIRTHDGTNDLGESRSTTLIMVTSATSDNPIEFVFDDGTKWGSSGMFTLTAENTAWVTFADFVNIHAGDETDRRLCLFSTYSSSLEHTPFQFRRGVYRGLYFDAIPTADTQSIRYMITNGQAVFYDPYFNMVFANIVTYYPVIASNTEGSYKMYNPTFNFNNLANPICAFSYSTNGMNSTVYGGKIINAIYDKHYAFFAPTGNQSNPSTFKLVGFDFGNANPVYGNPANHSNPIHVVTATARDNPFDFIYFDNHTKMEWWEDQDYPTLNGLLPDGTNWSLRATPVNSSATTVAECARITELYTLSPATKTISLDILVPDTYVSPLEKEYYINVVYIDDTTGSAKTLTSYSETGTLNTSTAAWSKVLHGDPAVTYNKFKLEVTTPTTIKQYSQIVATLSVARPQIISSDSLFVNPVLGLE